MKTIYFQHTYGMEIHDVLNAPVPMDWFYKIICVINSILFWQVTNHRTDKVLKKIFAAIIGYIIWCSSL